MLKQQYMYRTFYLELNFNEKLNEMIYCIYRTVRNKLEFLENVRILTFLDTFELHRFDQYIRTYV